MSAFLAWYVVLQAMALIAFALGWPLLRSLDDRGWTCSKALGILATGLLVWLGSAYGVLRNEAGGVLLALLALGAIAAWQMLRHDGRRLAEIVDWVRREARLVLVIELLFLAVFAGWALVRSYDPGADHTEQPMDLMFLTSVWSSPTYPPEDAWLAGQPISYYYLGYWLLATLCHASGVHPQVGYNLGQASWLALLVVATFGIGYNLRRADGDASRRQAAVAGVITSASVAIVANLALPFDWLQRRLAGEPSPFTEEGWWWWRSARVFKDVDLQGRPLEVITEFPFFSFLLGDNHPHLLSLPFLAATILVAFALCNATRDAIDGRGGNVLEHRNTWPSAGRTLLLAGVAGAFLGLNTWDVPVAAALLGGGLMVAWCENTSLRRWRLSPLLAGIAFAALLLVIARLLYWPYFQTASSQLRGLLPNLFNPSPILAVLLFFAPLLPGIALLLAKLRRAPIPRGTFWGGLAIAGLAPLMLVSGALWATHSERGRGWLLAMGLEAGASPWAAIWRRWSLGWPPLLLAALALSIALWGLFRRAPAGEQGRAERFALLLAALGLGVALLPELVFLHDGFGNRMNTVFKFYYQAWLLLACAGSWALARWCQSGASARRWLVTAPLVLGLLYAPTALWSKTGGFQRQRPTLDALAWVDTYYPDEAAVVRWIRQNVPLGARLAQASGNSYQARHNLISTATARPALLGWVGHELQWRGAAYGEMVAGRPEALEAIYRPDDAAGLLTTLDRWGIAYVLLGPLERERYGVEARHEEVLEATLLALVRSPTVTLYGVQGSHG